MVKYTVKTYNNIAKVGLDELGPDIIVASDTEEPDAIILRSQDLHNLESNDNLQAVARAGAGVNNIPVQAMSAKGIVVFNTPGANANAVKEAVLAGLLIAARNIVQAANYTKELGDDDIKSKVENGKKQFAGRELSGQTLGVIGLGAIGYKVANTAVAIGMKVRGYDPLISDLAKAQLKPEVELVDDILKLAAEVDYLTVHVPLLDATKGIINSQILSVMPLGSVLFNFSRDLVVDEEHVLQLLDTKKLKYYVTDFPNILTKDHPQVIGLPHLGASTAEAEDTCAIMASNQLRKYLETGNIENSVNFPNIDAGIKPQESTRLVVLHGNVPGVVAKISNCISQSGINIHDMLNKNRGKFACSVLDIDVTTNDFRVDTLCEQLRSLPDIIKVRSL